jgi:antitoxin component YwqK of YwqJK toxin-antitoxin module
MKKIVSFFILLTVLISAQAFAQDVNKLDENGKKHGLWRGYFEESQRVKYEGTFDHGKETGIFTFYDDTKIHTVVATRDFTKGDNSAYTIFYDPKKNVVSEGNVVNKVYDGPWKYYHEASKTVMTLENYKNGKLDGKRIVNYPDGKIAEEANYVNGIQEGQYKKYTDIKGAVLEEVNYKNGQVDGIAIYRDADGSIVSKGPYVNGLKKGIWEFYKDGTLTKKQKYPLRQKFAKLPPKKEN